MTIRTLQTPLRLHPTDALTAAEPTADASRSIATAGTTAGAGLLLMSALAGFGYQVAVKGLVAKETRRRQRRRSWAIRICFGSAS